LNASPAVEKELLEIARVEDRTPTAINRALLLRGLAAYKRDGKLKDAQVEIIGRAPDITPKQELPILREGPPKRARRKAS